MSINNTNNLTEVNELAAGQRVVIINGVAYAAGVGGMHASVIGGRRIGDVFSSLSSYVEPGSALLNGQTIEGCDKAYPGFWKWLNDRIGVGEGEDIVDHLELTPVYGDWKMPAMTANGSEDDEYSVSSTSEPWSTNYEAFKSFDGVSGGAKTYAAFKNTTSASITFKSKHKLKLNSITFQNPTYTGSSNKKRRPKSITIYVMRRIDGEDYLQPAAAVNYDGSTNKAETVVLIGEDFYTVDNPGYDTWVFSFTNNGDTTYTEIPEITLKGECFKYLSYTNKGSIRTITMDHFDDELTSFGLCAGFGLDPETRSVRLPRLVGCVLWGADETTIGKTLPAGLPDVNVPLYTESKVVENHMASGGPDLDSGGQRFSMGAWNEIYGRSDTVQPPAGCLCHFIQLYHSTVNAGEVDASALNSNIQSKADLSLTNTLANIDFVVEREILGDGSAGYELWRSGYIRQYGRATPGVNKEVIKFHKKFRDVNYNITLAEVLTSSDTGGVDANPAAFDLTQESFTLTKVTARPVHWSAIGYISTSN